LAVRTRQLTQSRWLPSADRPAKMTTQPNIRHRVIAKLAAVMDGRMMLRCVVIFTCIYVALIATVTCSKNHDVMKQVRHLIVLDVKT